MRGMQRELKVPQSSRIVDAFINIVFSASPCFVDFASQKQLSTVFSLLTRHPHHEKEQPSGLLFFVFFVRMTDEAEPTSEAKLKYKTFAMQGARISLPPLCGSFCVLARKMANFASAPLLVRTLAHSWSTSRLLKL